MDVKYHLHCIVILILIPGKDFTERHCVFDRTLDLNVSALTVYFYNYKDNVTLKTYLANSASELFKNGLDTSRRLVLFMPGYRSIVNGQTGDWIREVFTETDAYLLIVDYSPYTHSLNPRNYAKAVTYAYYIGRAVGKALADLNKHGYPSKNMLCVGHSFGGPLLGYIGETYIKETSEKLGRVTAVEPAGPCFGHDENRIRSGIADCVDVIHCTSGNLSITSTLADVDAFINAELKSQPDCYDGFYLKALGKVDAETCGHVICFKYWTWSVIDPSSYKACSSYETYVKGTCRDNYSIVGYHGNCDVLGTVYASTDTFHGLI